MSNLAEQALKSAIIASAKYKVKKRSNRNVVGSYAVKGILVNREPPITAGWCGNDNCEHQSHKERRRAQAAAETRKERQAGKTKGGKAKKVEKDENL